VADQVGRVCNQSRGHELRTGFGEAMPDPGSAAIRTIHQFESRRLSRAGCNERMEHGSAYLNARSFCSRHPIRSSNIGITASG